MSPPPEMQIATERRSPLAARRRVIVVAPAHPAAARRRLFRALEMVFAVTFSVETPSRSSDWDGLLALGREGADALQAVPQSCPVLLTGDQRATSQGPASIAFADTGPLAYPLRARTLIEGTAPAVAQRRSIPADQILATAAEEPVWWRANGPGWQQESSYPLPELAQGETLRDHLRAGRFIRLVPLLHFLWHVCGELEPGPRPLQASFVVDDPNLHWPSYGYLKYDALARHADEHGYHVGFATVPLDGWLTNRRAASLFRGADARLSLLMHGNNHTARELAVLKSDRQALSAVSQALRRVARIEKHAGVPIRRVMAPPHGACSEPAARAMFSLGLDAACVSRPYPWRDGLGAMSPADGWFPAESAAGGLTILPRYALDGSREELVFRALLGQPLILYGHHGDLSGGLDMLAQAACDVNRLGSVTWSPLDRIASCSYRLDRDGERLLVRMHARRVTVTVPEGVSHLSVGIPVMHGEPLWCGVRGSSTMLEMTRAGAGWLSEPLPVAGVSDIALELVPREAVDPDSLKRGRPAAWPLLRRLLVESRDRTAVLRHGRRRSRST